MTSGVLYSKGISDEAIANCCSYDSSSVTAIALRITLGLLQ